MPLITCPECDQYPVSTHAERCTKCGMPVEKMLALLNNPSGDLPNRVHVGYASACRLAKELCAAGVKEATLKSAIQQIRQWTSSLSITDRIESAKQTSVLVLTDGAVDVLRDLPDEFCVDIKELHVLGDYKAGTQLTQFLHRLLNLDVLDISMSNFELEWKTYQLPSIATLALRFCPKLDGVQFSKYTKDNLCCKRLLLDGNRQIDPAHFLLFLGRLEETLNDYSIAGCSLPRYVEDNIKLLIQNHELEVALTTAFK